MRCRLYKYMFNHFSIFLNHFLISFVNLITFYSWTGSQIAILV